MIYESYDKPDSCSICKSKRIAYILYGYPNRTPKLLKKISNGEIILGGCCITEHNPKWICMDCKVSIHKKKDKNKNLNSKS